MYLLLLNNHVQLSSNNFQHLLIPIIKQKYKRIIKIFDEIINRLFKFTLSASVNCPISVIHACDCFNNKLDCVVNCLHA